MLDSEICKEVMQYSMTHATCTYKLSGATFFTLYHQFIYTYLSTDLIYHCDYNSLCMARLAVWLMPFGSNIIRQEWGWEMLEERKGKGVRERV